MFEVNEFVSYSAQGVCQITDICEKTFAGQPATYYVLRPVYDARSVIYVPVEQPSLTSKMRRILSEAEILSLVRSMPREVPAWIENDTARHDTYRRALAGGDRAELIRVIKALYQRREQQKQNGKKLHLADETLLKDAEKLLYEEFAYVLGIERDRVLPFILQELGETAVG